MKRAQTEYDESRILGANVIFHDEIEEKAEQLLAHKDPLILVYCRSGRRSQLAAESLVKLGHTKEWLSKETLRDYDIQHCCERGV